MNTEPPTESMTQEQFNAAIEPLTHLCEGCRRTPLDIAQENWTELVALEKDANGDYLCADCREEYSLLPANDTQY